MESFPSKVDAGVGALMALPPLATAAAAVIGLVRGVPTMAIPLAFVALLYVGLVYPVRYDIGDDALVIRFGLARSRVPYETIRRVVPTQNLLSNPALSLDRLHVDAGNPLGPCISPAEETRFLDALAAKTPHLRREGRSLVPR